MKQTKLTYPFHNYNMGNVIVIICPTDLKL